MTDFKIGSLSKDAISKIIRLFIVALSYLCLAYICDVPMREVHQFFFMMTTICIFALLLKNIWVTLFLWWTVFLMVYYRFQLGNVYLLNILFGGMIYYLVKLTFKKEHISWFINMLLWLCVINLLYMVVQLSGLDFLFGSTDGAQGSPLHNSRPLGFMGNLGYTGTFFAFMLPLLMTRRSKLGWIGSALLLVPLYHTRSFMIIIGALVGAMFVLFFSLPRKIWIIATILLVLLGFLFFLFVDAPGLERISMWKLALSHIKIHPVTGWGLDSFRTYAPHKNFCYGVGLTGLTSSIPPRTSASLWDNPHNIVISLLFEWGVIGLLLFMGYLRGLFLKFQNAIKDPNTIGLMGFIIVFLVISIAHFPIFLARLAVIIVPLFALYELSVE